MLFSKSASPVTRTAQPQHPTLHHCSLLERAPNVNGYGPWRLCRNKRRTCWRSLHEQGTRSHRESSRSTLTWAYLASHLKGRGNRKLFNIVRTYCMCIVYPRSGRTFQTAPLDTPKHDNCPRTRRLVVHWSGIWQILTLPTPARQLAPLCPKGTGMGGLRLQTLPTVTVPGRRAAGHRRQKRRSLYHTAGGGPKAPAPVVRDHRHHTQARPAARPRRCCVDHRRKLSLQM